MSSRYSVTVVASDRSLPITDLARMVEERGFDGLWLADHTHTPVHRDVAAVPSRPDHQRHERMLDPLVGLAMAATATTRLALGTGVLLIAQRDPIVTAKALASIDQQSSGRLCVGVGFGWNVSEMSDHGVDPSTRRARVREHVEAMRRLWEDDVAQFAGTFVQFGPSTSWPKPVQRPLPILLGAGVRPGMFADIAAFGQGWIPVGGTGMAAAIPDLRAAVRQAGRQVEDLRIVPFTSGECDHDKIDYLERAGATEIAFDIPDEDPSSFVGALDRLSEFAAQRRRASRRRDR